MKKAAKRNNINRITMNRLITDYAETNQTGLYKYTNDNIVLSIANKYDYIWYSLEAKGEFNTNIMATCTTIRYPLHQVAEALRNYFEQDIRVLRYSADRLAALNSSGKLSLMLYSIEQSIGKLVTEISAWYTLFDTYMCSIKLHVSKGSIKLYINDTIYYKDLQLPTLKQAITMAISVYVDYLFNFCSGLERKVDLMAHIDFYHK